MPNETNGSPLRVLLKRGKLKGTWIAVCLEHYIVAQGSSTDDVVREFKAMLAAEIIYWMMHGGQKPPLSDLGPAPEKYWRMAEMAKPFDPPIVRMDLRIEPVPSIPVREHPVQEPEMEFSLAA